MNAAQARGGCRANGRRQNLRLPSVIAREGCHRKRRVVYGILSREVKIARRRLGARYARIAAEKGCEQLGHKMTHPHTCDLAVGSGTFARPADGKVEEGEEIEDVGEGRVQAVVVRGMIVADFIQSGD